MGRSLVVCVDNGRSGRSGRDRREVGVDFKSVGARTNAEKRFVAKTASAA